MGRTHDMTLVDDMGGSRDGYIVTATRAVAYASCRTWRDDDADCVEIDLLAGEVV